MDNNEVGMEALVEAFIKKSRPENKERYKHMIVSLGTSYEPIVLSIRLWEPEHVLFLCTKETEPLLNKVFEHIDLKPSQYQKAVVNATKVLSLYQEIKKVYYEWGKPKYVVVDPTGGTKAMTAATAMAGFTINALLVYVAGDYDQAKRRPMPLTEHLEIIDNPLKAFGELDQERADLLFDAHDYYSAKIIYERLSMIQSNQMPFNKGRFHLASMYEAWDNLKFEEASAQGKTLKNFIIQNEQLNGYALFGDQSHLVMDQIQVVSHLETLNQEPSKSVIDDIDDVMAWLMTLLEASSRRAAQGKYDMSVLLIYRILEMMMQRRLNHYGIATNAPNYNKMKQTTLDRTEMTQKYSNISHKLRGTSQQGRGRVLDLPNEISMLKGYIVLGVLNDSILGSNIQGFLSELKQKNEIRNNNIFTHGFTGINEKAYSAYKKFMLSVLERFCQIEAIDFVTLQQQYTFIKIGQA